MNTELTHKLVNRFPMYSEYYLPMNQTCMCWGFEHGDGWFDIIWQLSLAIEDMLKDVVATESENAGKTTDQVFKVQQVKEKFGTLRFYCHYLADEALNERLNRYIRYAEVLSVRTCELCGKPGKLNGESWLSVRCSECDPERHEDKEETV